MYIHSQVTIIISYIYKKKNHKYEFNSNIRLSFFLEVRLSILILFGTVPLFMVPAKKKKLLQRDKKLRLHYSNKLISSFIHLIMITMTNPLFITFVF